MTHQDWYWTLVGEGRVLYHHRHGLSTKEITKKLGVDQHTVDRIIRDRFGTTFGCSRRGNIITGYEEWPVKVCKGCGVVPFECPKDDCSWTEI